MRFTAFSTLSTLTLSAISFASAAIVPVARQVISAHGSTVAPPDGSAIAPGATFAFNYENSNTCEAGYSPISVYLSTSAPTDGNVTTGGELVNGSFIFKFGDFLIPNFGLPAMQNPPPPPSTLTMPNLSVTDDTTLFFSVVETFQGCPPDGHIEHGLETTTVVYA